MGSRHNRKRTRSRPRNRKNGFTAANAHLLTFTSPFALHQSPYTSPLYFEPAPAQPSHLFTAAATPAVPVQHQTPQERLRQQRLLFSQRHEAAMEDERMRMFGGEKGDPVSLCGPMLRVVMELFEGNVDYVDP